VSHWCLAIIHNLNPSSSLLLPLFQCRPSSITFITSGLLSGPLTMWKWFCPSFLSSLLSPPPSTGVQGLALPLEPCPQCWFCFCYFSNSVSVLCPGWPGLQYFCLYCPHNWDDRHAPWCPAFH
jgi:hypothetical protein